MRNEACFGNKKYSEEELNNIIDIFANLVIDSFIDLRRNKIMKSDKIEENSNTVRFFNGRLRQS